MEEAAVVTVPEGTAPGGKFSMQVGQLVFEVVCPLDRRAGGEIRVQLPRPSQQMVLQQQVQQRLFWEQQQRASLQAPHQAQEWEEHTSPEGQIFYYNPLTGATSWE